MTSSLNRYCELSLLSCGQASDASWIDLASVSYETSHEVSIFVIDNGFAQVSFLSRLKAVLRKPGVFSFAFGFHAFF